MLLPPWLPAPKVNPSIPVHYHWHAQVFDKEALYHFPLAQNEDHAIIQKPDTPPLPSELKCKVYPQTVAKKEAMHIFIHDHLKKEYITESSSPYVSLFFFKKKKDGKLHPIMNYHVLNSWTIQDAYPLPLLALSLSIYKGRSFLANLTSGGDMKTYISTRKTSGKLPLRHPWAYFSHVSYSLDWWIHQPPSAVQ